MSLFLAEDLMLPLLLPIHAKKKERNFRFSPLSTQSRGRTGTGVNLLVFETSASTDSAIWASVFD